MRQPTLATLGLGSVLEIFQRGRLPLDSGQMVDQIFGPEGKRGSLVVSGANGIVGAGKMMQLGSRLAAHDIILVGLDFPNSPDGIGQQYPGLLKAFGQDQAGVIMSNIVRMNYDGNRLPGELKKFRPAFLLEAIPEILEVKKNHYRVFRESYPGISICSVTSGFPSSQLGVGIAHPAFPHEINKVWEMVEPEPNTSGKLLWSLGLIPVPVSDDWSFVLDVLFCGLTLAALRYHRASNMPFWKVDKFVRKLLGPNPFRAHDAIGARGANFLTWSCLHHLSKEYGDLFAPTPELVYRKDSGQNWYPLNHARPVVNWSLGDEENELFETWLLGPLIQMVSLMLHESRSHYSHINSIGELCAQFRSGIMATIRELGADEAIKRVKAYHRLHPEAAKNAWYPEVFSGMEETDWQQLYVNAEHNGTVGLISISRESYNGDVDAELNWAVDWLKSEGMEKVIVTGDFHLSTQMVGADTSEFYAALENSKAGLAISTGWSRTARRLNDEFRISVGYVHGKRCLGGMLELLAHCHYLVTESDTMLGMPEVTLPVVPGIEGCHWLFRKASPKDWAKILRLLLTGKSVPAAEAVGWLIDFAGPLDKAVQKAWAIVAEADHDLPMRKLNEKSLSAIPTDISLPSADSPAVEAARKAILDCINQSCGTHMPEALEVQAKHSAGFMCSRECRQGMIGSEASKILSV